MPVEEKPLQKFEDFFRKKYKSELNKVAQEYPDKRSLEIPYSDLEKYDPGLADALLDKPDEHIAAAEKAIQSIKLPIKEDSWYIHLRIYDLPEARSEWARNLRSQHLNKMIMVEGLVRTAADVRPQATRIHFECPACLDQEGFWQDQPTVFVAEPFACPNCGRKGKFKILSRDFVDTTEIRIQEPPEAIIGSEQPSVLRVELRDDLVAPDEKKKILPGNEVIVTGILRERQIKPTSNKFDIFLDAVHIETKEMAYEEIELTPKDIKEIKAIAADPEVYDKLVDSIAPSIYGYREIKEAILLQLFGGVAKEQSDGSKIRGDIHLLLIGDPGTGKSQMMRYVANLAPKGRYVSGKGASAAGLCVAPDSLVSLSDGALTRIDSLVENQFGAHGEKIYQAGTWISKNPVSERDILSLNGRNKIEESEASQFWRIKAPSTLNKIRTRCGKELITTPQTRLLTINNGEILWKRATDLKRGEHVATARHLSAAGKVPLTGGLIKSDPIVYGCGTLVQHAITKLKNEKNITTRELAKTLGIKENKLYHHWVRDDAAGNPPLSSVLSLAKKAGIGQEDALKSITGYSTCMEHKVKLPLKPNKELLYFAGLVAGDGAISPTPRGGCSIRFTSPSPELLREYNDLVGKLFGLSPEMRAGSAERPPSIRFHSKIVGEILGNLGVPYSPKSHKINPSESLLALPNDLVASFARGLFDSDGGVADRGGKGGSYIEFNTASESLARKLQLALLRFDINAKLRKRQYAGKKTQSTLKNGKKRSIHSKHDKYALSIYGLSNLRGYSLAIGFSHPQKKKKLEKIIREMAHPDTNADVVPGLGSMLRLTREGFGLARRDVYGYKNDGYESGSRNPSYTRLQELVKKFEELEKLKKERIEISPLLKQKLYRTALEHATRNELANILGVSQEQLSDYFLRKKRNARVPLDKLRLLCKFLKAKGWHELSLEKIGLLTSPTISEIRKQRKAAEKNLEKLGNLAFSDIYWDEIVETGPYTNHGYEYVYDLTTNDSHNFIVNGILTHNTAAAIKDEVTGGWMLEAGALVLANMGIACVDEFEKMGREDRGAIHEALEQQQVSVAKAGIVTSLSARTSVLAAANPKYGRFDPYRSIAEQIELDAAILSRFDLKFPIQDKPSKETDTALADHILKSYIDKTAVAPVFDPPFLRKYVAHARQNVHPQLTMETMKMLKDFYVDWRERFADEETGSVGLTPRQLEATSRLAEASAKIRLSQTVDISDVERATRLLESSLRALGTDKDTGKIDIDRIETGISSAQRSRIHILLDIIRELEERVGKRIPVEDIYEAAKEKEMNITDIDSLLNKLKQKGDLYEPKPGYLQRA